MTKSVSLRRRPQQGAARGQVLPLVVLGLVPLLGLSALAIDLGFWRYQQRLQQAAADSAAIAGATELQYSTVAANVSAAAVKDATTNGYTADGSSVFVTVNNPPASGNYSTKSDAVEVIVRKVQPKYFAGIFGSVSSSESVRAVAELTSNMSDCVLALIPAASPYTMFTTGGSLSAPTCNVVDDGTWELTGGTVNAEGIGVVGAVTSTGGTYSQATPAPTLAAPDPCGSIAGCAYLKGHTPILTSCVSESISNGTTALPPGNYCQIDISNGTVNLTTGGEYNLTGKLHQSGGTLNGPGVTFYMAAGSNVDLTGGVANLSAPTSGNTNGMLFYQVPGNANTAKITGGGSSACPAASPNFTGIFYAPGAQLDVTGGTWDPSVIIVGQFQLTGGSLTCISDPTGVATLKRAALVE